MKMNQLNKEGKLDGYWDYYFSNGILSYKGNFKNGKPHDYWEHHYGGKFVKMFYI